MHLCKMIDQCLIDRSLLHKLFELSNLSYLHSNLHLHHHKRFVQYLVDKFPLHKQFESQILCYQHNIQPMHLCKQKNLLKQY